MTVCHFILHYILSHSVPTLTGCVLIDIVTTLVGSTASTVGIVNGFGTSTLFGLIAALLVTSSGKLYIGDFGHNKVRVADLTGGCPSGQFAATHGSTASCTTVPAGYYKPFQQLTDNYYICPSGTYSLSGATACTSCPSNVGVYGASTCAPSAAPTLVPTATPTVGCMAGSYLSGGSCVINAIGE